jgi:hypothetical protein
LIDFYKKHRLLHDVNSEKQKEGIFSEILSLLPKNRVV